MLLFMATHTNGQAIIFCSCGFFLSLFLLLFFPHLISAVADWCLPYFYTLCGFSANLECRPEMCCTHVAGNTGRKNDAKISTSGHHHTTLSSYVFATKACIDNWKKFVTQQYLSQMSPQYGELLPTNGWDRLASLGHASKFQRVSHHGFVPAPTSLNGGQPNFARCLAVSWAGTLYTVKREAEKRNQLVCVCDFLKNQQILMQLYYGRPV